MSAPFDTVNIREFARLDGCSDKLVRQAISEGKLRVSADGKLDPALAGTGWRRTNRRTAEGADTGADTAQMSAAVVRTSKRDAKVSAPADETYIATDKLAPGASVKIVWPKDAGAVTEVYIDKAKGPVASIRLELIKA